jgi:hypothetical protein
MSDSSKSPGMAGYSPKEREAYKCLDAMRTCMESSNFSDLVKRWKQWDVQWRMKIRRDLEKKPWPHASDYNPPITFSKVEDVHSVLRGFFSNPSFFSMAPAEKKGLAEDEMRKRGETWTELMRWSMQNETNSLSFLDKFCHDGTLFGCSFGHLPWLRLSRMMQTEFFIPEGVTVDGKGPDKELIIAALGPALLDGPTLRKNEKEGDAKVFYVKIMDDDGDKKDAIAWVDRDSPYRSGDDPVVIVERERVYYNAPRPRSLAPWNVITWADTADLQTARDVWVIEYLSINEIKERKQSRCFNQLTREDIKRLEDEAELMATPGSMTEEEEVEESRDYDLGFTKHESQIGLIKIVYHYTFEDVNGDDMAESIVRAVADVGKPILCMRHRIEYLYPHGYRPIFDWHFVPVDHRYYGMGIPEILEGTQNEINADFQARSDVIELTTKPVLFYDPMSGLAPNIIELTPGMMIKSRDPKNACYPMTFATDPRTLLTEQSLVEGQAERAIGSTDIGLGRTGMRPNAPRTLGGTAIAVRQQQLRTDTYLSRAMWGTGEITGGVREFLQQYHLLYAALMPKEKEFRALGTDELRSVNRSDLQGRYDFIIDFGEAVNNPQIRMQNAVLRYQHAMTNPLVMQNVHALYRITIDMLEATGMKNAARVLPKPADMAEHPPMTQDEENIVMSKGIYIDPLPTDKHAEHLTNIAVLIQDSIKLASSGFTPESITLLGKHAQKHMDLQMQAAQMMGAKAQQPGGGQSLEAQMNSPMGPGPTGEASMEPQGEDLMAGGGM